MRIVLIGVDASERARLRTILNENIVAEADDISTCLWLAQQHRPDLILIDAEHCSEETLRIIGIIRSQGVTPVLLCTSTVDDEIVERAVDAGVAACAPRASSREVLQPQIRLAVTRWQEIRDLTKELADANGRYQDRVVIEKAKGLLMQVQPGLSEESAYEMMRRTSMSKRTPLREIAQAILLTNGLVGATAGDRRGGRERVEGLAGAVGA